MEDDWSPGDQSNTGKIVTGPKRKEHIKIRKVDRHFVIIKHLHIQCGFSMHFVQIILL
jgi:hypothetical protein